MNILCYLIELWVTAVHDLDANIFYSFYLFGCVFLFPDCDSEFCDSAHHVFVGVLNARLYFGLYSALGQPGKIWPGFLHQYHILFINLIFCQKNSCYSSSVSFYSFLPLLFCSLKMLCFNVSCSVFIFT